MTRRSCHFQKTIKLSYAGRPHGRASFFFLSVFRSFPDHQADDLFVCAFHAFAAEAPDAADGVLDALHHDAVAALELLAVDMI